MKKALSVAALLVALTGSALAADLPSYKAPPPPPPPPPPLWSGFYVGLNAGGMWGGSNNIWTSSAPISSFPGSAPSALYAAYSALGASGVSQGNTSGFIGGGQIGYNWQFWGGRLVAGVEADIQGVASGNSNNTSVTAAGAFPFIAASEIVTTAITTSKRLDYIGTVRGRLGWLFTPTLLVYGTGGLAYGGVSVSTGVAQFNNDCAQFPAGCITSSAFSSGSFSDTRVGWTAGAGLEWMFMPNWSAKVEYLYYDLGNVSYSGGLLTTFSNTLTAFPAGSLISGVVTQSQTRFNGNIVRAGVNYHFNWGAAPIVAKY
ncbi:outer membrane protein [Methylocystis sp.]|uniref:outer membrane protein n=1 Tax=Methylocystis sp. TaxID=1911079 RepID=UPI002734030C|nr:outer membrane beta-barrel protein [Methylocystis sp.]MDP3554680.1 outer membrane beta-barrel protein [Methylocystis sp.]